MVEFWKNIENIGKHQKTMVEPMFYQKVIIQIFWLFWAILPTNIGQNIVDDHRLHQLLQ